MLYRKMGKLDDEVSILGYGCMRFPMKNGKIDEDKAISQMRYAIDKGVSYIDTAWPYHAGKSEIIVGKALKDGYRDKVKVATKLPQFLCKSKEDMYKFLNKQLEKLELEKIDYYLIHALNYQSWERMKNLGIEDFMENIKKEKKIENIGFSFHGKKDGFKKIVDEYNWDFCQIQYNILDEYNQAGKEGLEYAYEKGLGVVIMEPLLGGSLAKDLPPKVEKVYNESQVKRSNVEWALRWIWNHKEVVTILSGMNIDEHIEENIKIASEAEMNSLTEQELDLVNRASTEYKSLRKVNCTGCNYCTPCPFGVDIPGCFEIYNNKSMFGKKAFYTGMYIGNIGGIMGGQNKMASKCTECGVCIKKCPQNIQIPDRLKEVKKEFETPVNNIIMFIANKVMKKDKK